MATTTVKKQVQNFIKTVPEVPPEVVRESVSLALELLTEHEVYSVLYDAYTTKKAMLREIEYREKLKNKPKPRELTANELLEIVIQKGQKYLTESSPKTEPVFTLNDNEMKVYRLLAAYFTKDKYFEEGTGYSLKKGIFLIGNVGCGKTTCMKLFSSNPTQSYSVIPCRTVEREFAKNGYNGIEKYFHMIETNPLNNYGQRSIGTCFDDLGVENVAKNFGNERNVMAEIILSRYENEISSGQIRTHMTSNLQADKIEEYYGERVYSRLHDTFNFIAFDTRAIDKRIQ